MFDEGIQEVRRNATDEDASSMGDLAYAYAKAGRLDETRKILGKLVDQAKSDKEVAVAVAQVYSAVEESDRAIEWLEKAYADRIPYLVSANCEFAFETLRSDPRFRALMMKIGLHIVMGGKIESKL